jgi:regulatory protein YycI of two-component signal transduction system YycFG
MTWQASKTCSSFIVKFVVQNSCLLDIFVTNSSRIEIAEKFARSKREQDEMSLQFEFTSRQINQLELKTMISGSHDNISPRSSST